MSDDVKAQSIMREQLAGILASIEYPDTGAMLDTLLVDEPELRPVDSAVAVSIDLRIPVKQVAQTLAYAIKDAASEAGICLASIEIGQQIDTAKAANFSNTVTGVKNIIAVASGKGGVGKSTTSVNLALALAAEGARVGLLDADIYGPSQPQMLGLGDIRPEVEGGNTIVPLEAHGIQMISMGNMVTEKTPMIWRGPMASGALQQLLLNTRWDDVDYLIIDMPPGTGDIPLTLSQKVPVTGSVIVTTPQDIALLDAKKGIEMFEKVNIPVFGVVENMAVHVCSHCGHKEHIFGEDGGKFLAEQYDCPVLGQLPLAMTIRALTDAGRPPVVDDPDSAIAEQYRSIARKVAVAAARTAVQLAPEISVLND